MGKRTCVPHLLPHCSLDGMGVRATLLVPRGNTVNESLDVKATRELMNQVEAWLVYRCAEERELWKIVPACLDVIEQMAAVIQKIDLFGVALIARSYEPGSRTVRELVDEAHAALALVKRKATL